MKELKGDIFKVYDAKEWCTICIPCNGYVTKPRKKKGEKRERTGKAVMGRGVAKQAATRWPDLLTELGYNLTVWGNRVMFIRHRVLAFPTKGRGGISNGTNIVKHLRHRYPPGRPCPGWAMRSTLERIAISLFELRTLHKLCGLGDVYLPRPGCGAGGLTWRVVEPVCKQMEDWLIVMHN